MNITAMKIRLSRWLLAYAPGLYARLVRRGGAGIARIGHAPFATVSVHEHHRPRVLLVDHDFPELARDAGSKAIFHLVGLLSDKADVTFWSASTSPSKSGEALLRSRGIRVAARTDGNDLAQWLGSLPAAESFDAAILSRPLVAAAYADTIRAHVQGVCAYYGHDIHHARLAAMRTFTASTGLRAEQREIGLIERRLWRIMDAVFYPSSEEADVVNGFRENHRLPPNAFVLPLWDAPDPPPVIAPANARKGMLFVGSYDHAPNVDGLDWFFREVLPQVRGKGNRDVVYVVGSGMDSYRPPTQDTGVAVLGKIDDAALDQRYASVRMALIPLRYGAGVKGKVIEAMGKGVPCVTTSVGAHGIGWASVVLEPVDSAEAFARAIINLESDDALWQKKSSEGLSLLAAAYERSAISALLFHALGLTASNIARH